MCVCVWCTPPPVPSRRKPAREPARTPVGNLGGWAGGACVCVCVCVLWWWWCDKNSGEVGKGSSRWIGGPSVALAHLPSQGRTGMGPPASPPRGGRHTRSTLALHPGQVPRDSHWGLLRLSRSASVYARRTALLPPDPNAPSAGLTITGRVDSPSLSNCLLPIQTLPLQVCRPPMLHPSSLRRLQTQHAQVDRGSTASPPLATSGHANKVSAHSHLPLRRSRTWTAHKQARIHQPAAA